MTIPFSNRPRKTLPPEVIKQWREGQLEESKPRPSGRPSSYTALTDSEIHHRVAKWLYYMCGYRSNRVASELHGVSRVAVGYWLRGRHTPRDTLNNPSARLNFLCVELQSTDLFRPSLDRRTSPGSVETQAGWYGRGSSGASSKVSAGMRGRTDD